jgi:hypothetical protein
MNESTNEVPVEVARANQASTIMPVIMGVVISLVMLAIFFWGPKAYEKLQEPRVVVIDVIRIIESASKVAQNFEKPEEAMKLGEDVASKINTELAAYSAKGVVVLVKQAVLSAPAAHDITQEVAARIGVDISNVPSR